MLGQVRASDTTLCMHTFLLSKSVVSTPFLFTYTLCLSSAVGDTEEGEVVSMLAIVCALVNGGEILSDSCTASQRT